jgi:hypothetical protein
MVLTGCAGLMQSGGMPCKLFAAHSSLICCALRPYRRARARYEMAKGIGTGPFARYGGLILWAGS